MRAAHEFTLTHARARARTHTCTHYTPTTQLFYSYTLAHAQHSIQHKPSAYNTDLLQVGAPRPPRVQSDLAVLAIVSADLAVHRLEGPKAPLLPVGLTKNLKSQCPSILTI
jgi:hypothetical protein